MKYLLGLILLPLSLFATTKVAIIGDSISVGFGATPGHGFVSVLQQRYITEGKDIVLLNRSYGGAPTDTLFQIGITTMAMDYPDYIVIFLGINDAGLSIPQATLLNNFSTMMVRCKSNCKRIILGGVDPAEVNAAYGAVLTNVYTYLIATYNPYPVMLLGPDILPYCADGIHPNDTGHQLIADNLYNVFHLLGEY